MDREVDPTVPGTHLPLSAQAAHCGSLRLAEGGLIDRARVLSFKWNGVRLHRCEGDTLGSALLAHGKRVIGRSFKLHRPRGILSAGAEELNGLVALGRRGADRSDHSRHYDAPAYRASTCRAIQLSTCEQVRRSIRDGT